MRGFSARFASLEMTGVEHATLNTYGVNAPGYTVGDSRNDFQQSR